MVKGCIGLKKKKKFESHCSGATSSLPSIYFSINYCREISFHWLLYFSLWCLLRGNSLCDFISLANVLDILHFFSLFMLPTSTSSNVLSMLNLLNFLNIFRIFKSILFCSFLVNNQFILFFLCSLFSAFSLFQTFSWNYILILHYLVYLLFLILITHGNFSITVFKKQTNKFM